jgi:hypothetical protein
MTAQAEKANTQHAGNGDKAGHAEQAHQKTARDYYVKVEGKTREEARVIVERLVKGNMLQPIAFYVKAIKDEAIRQENLRKREEAQKARDEQAKRDEEARKERKAQEDKAKAEKKASKGKVEPEYAELDAMQDAMIKDFIKKGASKLTIKGLLKDLFGFTKGQVEYLINELFPEQEAHGRGTIFEGSTFKGRFYRRLLEGVMSREQFDEFIAAESENVIKHKSAHDNIRVMSNRIHEKYAR